MLHLVLFTWKNRLVYLHVSWPQLCLGPRAWGKPSLILTPLCIKSVPSWPFISCYSISETVCWALTPRLSVPYHPFRGWGLWQEGSPEIGPGSPRGSICVLEGKREREKQAIPKSVCSNIEDESLGGDNWKLAYLPLDHFFGWTEGGLGFLGRAADLSH